MAATDDYQKVIELLRRSENGGEDAALLECALDNVLLLFMSRVANSVTSEAKDENDILSSMPRRETLTSDQTLTRDG